MGELSSRLVTFPMLDGAPPSLRVSWIHWDSGFRDTELAPGDCIVAVNAELVKALKEG